MPQWMHDRAEHILAKNPSMPKGEAFAIATQQMHSLGKSPKSYGTLEARATAKAKFDTPKDDKKVANYGHLESAKMEKKAVTLGQLALGSAVPAGLAGGIAGYHKGGLSGAARGAAGAAAGGLVGGVGGAMAGTGNIAPSLLGVPAGAYAGYKASTHGVEEKKKEKAAGVLGTLWDAVNTPLPGTPKLIAGRNLGSLKHESTEVVKKMAPAAAKTKEQIMAARRASYKTASMRTFSEELQKLAYEFADKEAEHKLQGHLQIQDLDIAIENRKGSVRKGVDKDGTPWSTKMKYPYGYIEGTKGVDGDEVDVYVGPDKDAEMVYVVHQKKEDGKTYDEDKVMMGFKSEEAARAAYLKHYNDPKFLGPITAFSIEDFKKKLEEKEGKKLAGIADFARKARKVISTPIGVASNLGTPSKFQQARIRGGGIQNVLRAGTPANEAALMANKGSWPGRLSDLASGKRLHQLNEGAPYWGQKAEEVLERAPSALRDFADPNIPISTLRGSVAMRSEAMGKVKQLQDRSKMLKGQIGGEENAVAATRLGLGAAGLVGANHIRNSKDKKTQNRVKLLGRIAVPVGILAAAGHLMQKAAFQTSQYSTPIEGPKTARPESAQPGFRSPSLRHPLEKQGFTQGQYGSTGGYVDFHQVSSLPGFKRPSLATAIEKKSDFEDGEPAEKAKRAGVMTQSGLTPAAMLSSSKRVGMPKVTNPSGPSIADISKPVGFGRKEPGATIA